MGLKDRSGGEAKFAVDAQQVNHVHGTFTRGHVDWTNEIFPERGSLVRVICPAPRCGTAVDVISRHKTL